jgi:predicted NBD/HSP70 family sugar kinase
VAGEIGHIPLPGFTGPCHCGTRGCLEAAISLRSVEEHLARTGLVVSGPEAFEDNLSHPALARILQDNGRILGQALAWMCNLLAPSRVILGGWLAHAGRTHMADAAMAAVERHAHPVVVQALSIVNSELAPLAELKGALLLAQDTFATP